MCIQNKVPFPKESVVAYKVVELRYGKVMGPWTQKPYLMGIGPIEACYSDEGFNAYLRKKDAFEVLEGFYNWKPRKSIYGKNRGYFKPDRVFKVARVCFSGGIKKGTDNTFAPYNAKKGTRHSLPFLEGRKMEILEVGLRRGGGLKKRKKA